MLQDLILVYGIIWINANGRFNGYIYIYIYIYIYLYIIMSTSVAYIHLCFDLCASF